jgi:hypothetical protein
MKSIGIGIKSALGKGGLIVSERGRTFLLFWHFLFLLAGVEHALGILAFGRREEEGKGKWLGY